MSNNDVVILQLDRPRQLKFGHTAIKTLVALVGKDIETIDDELSPTNFELVEKMIYVGLLKDARDNDETLTLERVPELLDEAPSFIHVYEQFSAAWRAAWGAKEEGNQPEPVTTPATEKNTTGKKASA